MIPRWRTSLRTRLRLALLAACALLLQQLALAAYACTLDAAPAQTAMAAHCEGVPMSSSPGSAAALCGYHCAEQAPAAPDARTPTVPPAMLPALPPAAPALLPLALMSPPPAYCAAPHPSPPAAT
ncbi:MAG: hypothetical protein ABFC67_11450, partial [Mizugakiibacter sp.]|uniref:hypothetical protein n=1 Tax=Mizugakiibacter sp. TaxID=1972610 RepID=UPI00320D8BCF